MVSLLCAGIADPSLNEIVMPKLLTQGMLQCSKLAGFASESWPASNWNGGRLQLGMVAGFASESTP